MKIVPFSMQSVNFFFIIVIENLFFIIVIEKKSQGIDYESCSKKGQHVENLLFAY